MWFQPCHPYAGNHDVLGLWINIYKQNEVMIHRKKTHNVSTICRNMNTTQGCDRSDEECVYLQNQTKPNPVQSISDKVKTQPNCINQNLSRIFQRPHNTKLDQPREQKHQQRPQHKWKIPWWKWLIQSKSKTKWWLNWYSNFKKLGSPIPVITSNKIETQKLKNPARNVNIIWRNTKVAQSTLPDSVLSIINHELMTHDWSNIFKAETSNDKADIFHKEVMEIVDSIAPLSNQNISSDD